MATDPKDYQDFIKIYEQWGFEVLTPARVKLREIFDEWKKVDYWKKFSDGRQPAPTPIHRMVSRIKRPESAADKILRKTEDFSNGLSLESIKKLPDALGGRIVTYFLSGLPIVDNEIRNHPLIEISKDDPPIAYLDERLLGKLGLSHLRSTQKESGYSSIHYNVRLKPEALGGRQSPLIEIQLRTLTLDVWGEIEHVLGYKPHKRTSFAVQSQFELIASLLTTIDRNFNFLYEEQRRFRDEKTIEDSDPLNAENLQAVLDGFGLSCAQKEIDGLLKLLASRKITNVKEFKESATREKIEVIRNTYRSHEQLAPIDFEIVACIAATANIKDAASIQMMTEAQIDFLKSWEALKKG